MHLARQVQQNPRDHLLAMAASPCLQWLAMSKLVILCIIFDVCALHQWSDFNRNWLASVLDATWVSSSQDSPLHLALAELYHVYSVMAPVFWSLQASHWEPNLIDLCCAVPRPVRAEDVVACCLAVRTMIHGDNPLMVCC